MQTNDHRSLRLRLPMNVIASSAQAVKPVGSGTAIAVAENSKRSPSWAGEIPLGVPEPINVKSRLGKELVYGLGRHELVQRVVRVERPTSELYKRRQQRTTATNLLISRLA